MAADHPDAQELLEACAEHLDRLVAGPATASRYDLRLLQRALAVARTELRLRAEHEAAETASLRDLLGGDDFVDVLRARLAAEIRAGTRTLEDPALVAHLRTDTARRCLVSRD